MKRMITMLVCAAFVPLTAGIALAAPQATATQPPAPETTAGNAAAQPKEVVSDDDNDILGALRMNVTAGAIFFNGNHKIVKSTDANGVTTGTVQSPQFAQAASYFAVEAQPQLWKSKATAGEHSLVYLEPIVNVRFTTIAVSTGATITDATEGLLKSEKAAQVQVGVLLGLNFGKFEVGESTFHWSLAPVGRFMYQNVTDANRAGRVWDLDDDLYHAFAGGLRLSLYKGDTDDDSWRPTAYLEIGQGKFQNFERAVGNDDEASACLAAPSKCLGGTVPSADRFTTLELDRRWTLEARVALKHVYLGVDINNGHGEDDLRFIGGLTVGLDRFFNRE